MAVYSKFFSTALLVLALPSSGFTKTQPPETVTGWTLNQSSSFAGIASSEITPKALRMKIGRLGLTVVTKAPDWTVYLYNDNTHKYCELPRAQWKKRFVISKNAGLRGPRGELLISTKMSSKVEKIAGIPAIKCTITKRDVGSKGPATNVTDLWIATGIEGPPEIAQVFCSPLEIPVQKGLPLQVKQLKTKEGVSRMVTVLETLEARRGPLPVSLFEPMKGYTKVKDELQLIMDESTDDMMSGVLDSNSINEPRPSKH